SAASSYHKFSGIYAGIYAASCGMLAICDGEADLQIRMKIIVRLLPALLLVPLTAFSQARGSEFQITKITKNLISSPQYTYSGAQQYQADRRDMWLEVEVTFAAAPEITDDITFKYYIALNNKV